MLLLLLFGRLLLLLLLLWLGFGHGDYWDIGCWVLGCLILILFVWNKKLVFEVWAFNQQGLLEIGRSETCPS